MSTSAVSSDSWWKAPTTSSASSSSSASSTKGSNDLSDFGTFVKLLATELENQDPSDPVSNTEYVSQMAQVNTLSQLQTIKSGLETYRAYALIGETVQYTTTDSSGNTASATGKVTSVTTKDNDTYLTIDGKSVSLDNVTKVGTDTTSSDSTTTA